MRAFLQLSRGCCQVWLMVSVLRNDGIPIRHRRVCPRPTRPHCHSRRGRIGIPLLGRMRNEHSTGLPARQDLHTQSNHNRIRFLLSNDLLRHDGCTSSHAGIQQVPWEARLLLLEAPLLPWGAAFQAAQYWEVLFLWDSLQAVVFPQAGWRVDLWVRSQAG